MDTRTPWYIVAALLAAIAAVMSAAERNVEMALLCLAVAIVAAASA